MIQNFKRIETDIEGLCIIEPRVYGDKRGYFKECYVKESFIALGIETEFVQDNHSRSMKNVLRGLHYQISCPQAKLVRVSRGSVFDVAVDMREESLTFGKWFGIELSADNHLMLYIPKGFAHGFLTLEDGTEMQYKTSDYYHPEDEGGIFYADKDLKIQWPNQDEVYSLSDKDSQLQSFKAYLEARQRMR